MKRAPTGEPRQEGECPGSRVRNVPVRTRPPVACGDHARARRGRVVRKRSGEYSPLLGDESEMRRQRGQLIAHDTPQFVRTDGTALEHHGSENHGLALGCDRHIAEVLNPDHDSNVGKLFATHVRTSARRRRAVTCQPRALVNVRERKCVRAMHSTLRSFRLNHSDSQVASSRQRQTLPDGGRRQRERPPPFGPPPTAERRTCGAAGAFLAFRTVPLRTTFAHAGRPPASARNTGRAALLFLHAGWNNNMVPGTKVVQQNHFLVWFDMRGIFEGID
ncbi:hypothetical protein HPB48_014267 [Haemaphysalis longicornis]|uniref:Uncharacterized protein n=1 Tax=Haemaphysalis longicornis TaxID=44386 RepID=A0A9J6FJE9_HAELO|nr:hypothetical protein HPB48_014267 [Haemaphysalis longicornis]